MRGVALCAMLALTACIGGTGGETRPGAARGFVLDAGGIAPDGTPLRIDFGRHAPGVIDSVSRLQGRGPAAVAGPETCGAGIRAARWPDGVTLVFRDDAFAGWHTTDPGRSADGTLQSGATCPVPG